MTLNHLLTVDWFYLDALEEGGLGRSVYDNEIPCTTAKELIAAQRLADQRLIDFCGALTETELSKPVKLLRDDGNTLTGYRCIREPTLANRCWPYLTVVTA